MGRFTNQEPDLESATFHLEHAASCFYPKAVKTQAQIYLQLPHDVLSSLSAEVSSGQVSDGDFIMQFTYIAPACQHLLSLHL
jgi:hypothetical protein